MATIIIPAAPVPVTARPSKNTAKEGDIDVIIHPRQTITVDTNMHKRGEKSWHSRPDKGAMLDIAIKYEEVSQLASSNASKSAAIADCVVVRIDILVAVKA